jgi:hypothetical protein
MSHEPSKLWDDNGNLNSWEEDYKSWEPCVFTRQAHSRGSWMYPWRCSLFAICDFQDTEIGLGWTKKLWQLLPLLGESYIALGQALEDDEWLDWVLKAMESPCLVLGSESQLTRNRCWNYCRQAKQDYWYLCCQDLYKRLPVAEPKAVKAPEPVVGMDRGCWFNFEGHILIPWTFKGNWLEEKLFLQLQIAMLLL